MKLNLFLIFSFIGGIVLLLGATAAVGVGIKIRYDNLLDSPSALTSEAGALKAGCGAADQYLAIINEAALQYNIPAANIAAVIEQESEGNAQAKNKKSGASGLMQLLPGTFDEVRRTDEPVVQGKVRNDTRTAKANKDVYGKELSPNIFDSTANIYAGTQYLRYNLNRYDNNFTIVLAAYNAGPNDRYVMKKQVPPYEQTQNYVKRITKELIPKYTRCLKPATVSSGGSVSSDIGEVSRAAKAVMDYAAANPATVCQSTNNSGNNCAETAAITLGNTFKTNGKEGEELGHYKYRKRTDPPDETDFEQARTILGANNLPVWHINGEVSGQHWIIILKVHDDKRISFLDPATGRVDTRAYDTPSTVTDGKVAYFGITPQGSKGNNDQYLRGYDFPASKYLK